MSKTIRVVNLRPEPVDLACGQVLASGEHGNANPGHQHDAALLSANAIVRVPSVAKDGD